MRRIGVLTALLTVLVPATADASFPGQNGRIAFSGVSATAVDIYTVNPDGTGAQQLTNDAASDRYPAWSPDGQRIAWASSRDGNEEIYVMNADGSGQTRLTSNAGADLEPSWSPDGNQIAFASSRDGDYEIYVMNATGTGATNLTNNAIPDYDPAWSPDGSKIALTREAEDENFNVADFLFTMNTDGSGAVMLTGAGDPNSSCSGRVFADVHADWSPNGAKIAFRRWADFDGFACVQIESMNRDGSGRAVVKGVIDDNIFVYGFPAWSPDGTRIAYVHNGSIEISNPNGTGTVNIGRGGTNAVQDLDWQAIPINAYPRPRGATPMFLSLVPAYRPCTSPDRMHGAPLSSPSCSAPAPQSGTLTVGTPDSNGRQANSVGFAVMTTHPDNKTTPAVDEANVRMQVSISDVRRRAGLADYTGELEARFAIRITDKNNNPSPGGPGAGTVTETPFSYTVACTPTTADNIGSTCGIDTTANAVLPGVISSGHRMIWEAGRFEVHDGGPDGEADTPEDNELFAVQGLFVP